MISSFEESMSCEEPSAWIKSLRPHIAHIELVFNNGDSGHPLLGQLEHLESTRTVGVRPGAGYSRPRPDAVKRRFAYNRDILRTLDDLGGFFSEAASPDPWTALGDVDVVFLDKRGNLLGATVTHERMIITRAGSATHAQRL